MKATIYSNDIVIGFANLKVGDASMGHLYGDFIPNDHYFAEVQKYVWKVFSDIDGLDYAKLEPLYLAVRLENNHLLEPQGITLDDFRQFPDDAKRIDVIGLDFSKLEDHFKTTFF